MVWFYFFLLIPLTSALRRLDEPGQYDVLRGNKPYHHKKHIHMAKNADNSESESGEETRTRPPLRVKAPGLVSDWDRFVKWLFSNKHSRNAPMPRGFTMMMDGSAEKEYISNGDTFVEHVPSTKHYNPSKDSQLHIVFNSNEDQKAKTSQKDTFYEPNKKTVRLWDSREESQLQLVHNSTEDTSQPTETPGLMSQWDRIFKWFSSIHSNKTDPLRGAAELQITHNSSEDTKQPIVTYVHQENSDWKKKLWWFFFGNTFPKHFSGRASQVYEGFKEHGSLVLRKVSKDIDLAELDPDLTYQ